MFIFNILELAALKYFVQSHLMIAKTILNYQSGKYKKTTEAKERNQCPMHTDGIVCQLYCFHSVWFYRIPTVQYLFS